MYGIGQSPPHPNLAQLSQGYGSGQDHESNRIELEMLVEPTSVLKGVEYVAARGKAVSVNTARLGSCARQVFGCRG